MSKWIRSAVLAALVATGTAGLVTVSGPGVQGQGKADPKADPKAKAADPKTKVDPKPMPVEVKGSVVIMKDKRGEFRFQVKNDAGKVVMQSTVGYDTEKDAIKAFEDALAIAKAFKPVMEKAGDK